MTTNPQTFQLQLFENLVILQEALTTLGFVDLLADIKKSKKLLINKNYQVAVVGEFKKGKSTLINALLGSEVLPADSTPTTAIVSRIIYGDQPKIVIKYQDGKKTTINVKDLDQFITKQAEENLIIDEAIIQYPSLFSQGGIELIDTPGLNDEELMTKRTLACLQNVDAVIFTVHARIPFSETEKKSVIELIKNPKIKNLVFVITYIDQIEQEDRAKLLTFLKQRIQESVMAEIIKTNDKELINKAEKLLNKQNFYEVSSNYALKAYLINNLDLLKESKLPEFRESLSTSLHSSQLQYAFTRIITNITNLNQQLDEQQDKVITQLNNQIEVNNNINVEIEKYLQAVRVYVAKLFDQDRDKITKTIAHLNTMKNVFANKLLPLIDKNDTDVNALALALKQQLAKCEQLVVDKYQPAIINDLTDVLKTSVINLRNFRKTNLIDLLDSANITTIDSSKAYLSLNLIRNTFNKINFQWSGTIKVYSDKNQTEDSILQVIDKSVQDYIANFDLCMNSIAELTFRSINKEVSSLQPENLQQISKEQLATAIAVQQANFATYRPRVETIINQVKDLQTSLENNF